MKAVLIASALDPVFWALIWFCTWCGFRLPQWSWLKLPLVLLWLGGLGGIIVLQAHIWEFLAPPATNHGVFDQVLFPEIIPGLVLAFWRAFREDQAKKKQEVTASQQ